jgi:PEP-CTERM motif
MRNLLAFLTLLSLTAIPTVGRADSILVGTDLSSPTGGAVLCPQGSNCSIRISQFILLSPVVIDDVKVALSGLPTILGMENGGFNVILGNALVNTHVPPDFPPYDPVSGAGIGSGNYVFLPDGDLASEVFDFSNLNITLGPGVYYLEVSGADVEWDSAPPLMTSAGLLGLQLECDPFLNCGSDLSRYGTFPGTYAMEIDGTVTPEPSTFVLLGTGLLGAISEVRRRLR